MEPKVRRLVVIVGASAALGVAGCGGAASSSQSSGDQSGPSQGRSS
jgi:phosphoribosylformylglycinamidine (FGAM) synthase-like enzyme